MVDAIFGEVRNQFIRIQVGPGGDEFSYNFFVIYHQFSHSGMFEGIYGPIMNSCQFI
jgi:hypothetical protein